MGRRPPRIQGTRSPHLGRSARRRKSINTRVCPAATAAAAAAAAVRERATPRPVIHASAAANLPTITDHRR